MWELFRSGGWLMWPILGCSIVAMAIVGERFWALRRPKVIPRHLVAQTWNQLKQRKITSKQLKELREASPLGRVLAAGLVNLQQERSVMLEAIEDVGRHEAHRLERFLNTLGTIASISPLLGLLGTVIGMIQVFAAIETQGLGSSPEIAGGISTALITTAAGLFVAIPSLMAYRYFRGKVDELVVEMEQEALKLVEVVHGQRDRGAEESA